MKVETKEGFIVDINEFKQAQENKNKTDKPAQGKPVEEKQMDDASKEKLPLDVKQKHAEMVYEQLFAAIGNVADRCAKNEQNLDINTIMYANTAFLFESCLSSMNVNEKQKDNIRDVSLSMVKELYPDGINEETLIMDIFALLNIVKLLSLQWMQIEADSIKKD